MMESQRYLYSYLRGKGLPKHEAKVAAAEFTKDVMDGIKAKLKKSEEEKPPPTAE